MGKKLADVFTMLLYLLFVAGYGKGVEQTIIDTANTLGFYRSKHKKSGVKTYWTLPDCGESFCRIAPHENWDCDRESHCESPLGELKGQFTLKCGNHNGGAGWRSHDVCNMYKEGAQCQKKDKAIRIRGMPPPQKPDTICWPKYYFHCTKNTDCGRGGKSPRYNCEYYGMKAHECRYAGYDQGWATLHDTYGPMKCGPADSCPWKDGYRCCMPKDQRRCEMCKRGICWQKAIFHADAKCRKSKATEVASLWGKGKFFKCDVTKSGCPAGETCYRFQTADYYKQRTFYFQKDVGCQDR